MTAQEHPFSRVELLINTFADWLRHRRDLSEIRRMDTTEFDRIAGDLRVSPGELDTLAQRGELTEAIALETLWNDLGERVPFFLLCGYSAAHFVATSTHRALRDICGSHSGVHRHAQDPLASWLLNSAHNASGAAGITH